MWLFLGLITIAFNYKRIIEVFDGLHAACGQLITNRLAKKCISMHHKYYIVEYPYGVSWYKIIVPRNRRPCLIDDITDAHGCSVKTQLKPYLGPGNNFHGQRVTPNLLGFSRLTFTYANGDELTFGEFDEINILL